MNKHALTGIKQSSEHIQKRVKAVAKTKAAWTKERHKEFVNKTRDAIQRRNPVWKTKVSAKMKGYPAWNKGIKMPQYSGQKHWNWGNNMPQESIEKMRQGLIGKKQSPELIKKRVDARAGYRHSPETKLKIGSANKREGNGCWKGGISHEPYAVIWANKRFKNGIRKRDNYICQNPECRGDCDVLCIHHIDYDKKNCEPENLISLCRSCNGRANFNRDFWEAGYKEIIRIKYQTDEQLIAV